MQEMGQNRRSSRQMRDHRVLVLPRISRIGANEHNAFASIGLIRGKNIPRLVDVVLELGNELVFRRERFDVP